MVYTAYLLSAQHEKYCVVNKRTSSLVVSLGKARNGMPTFLRGRLVVEPNSYPSSLPSLSNLKRLASVGRVIHEMPYKLIN